MEDIGGSSLFRQQHPREGISISDNDDESYSHTIEDGEIGDDGEIVNDNSGGASLYRQMVQG